MASLGHDELTLIPASISNHIHICTILTLIPWNEKKKKKCVSLQWFQTISFYLCTNTKKEWWNNIGISIADPICLHCHYSMLITLPVCPEWTFHCYLHVVKVIFPASCFCLCSVLFIGLQLTVCAHFQLASGVIRRFYSRKWHRGFQVFL